MTTLIDFLHEIEQSRQTVVIPAGDVQRLIGRFGPIVRSMGYWDKAGDGSIEIPMSNVVEAVRVLGGDLSETISQLNPEDEHSRPLDRSSAARLIEALSDSYLRQFENRVSQFQETPDSEEVAPLWPGIARDLFGA